MSYFSREKIHAKDRRAAKQEEAQSESLPENDGHTGNVPLSGTSDSRTQIRVRQLRLLLFRHHRLHLLLFLLHLLLLLLFLFCTYSRNIAWRELIRKGPRVTTDETSRRNVVNLADGIGEEKLLKIAIHRLLQLRINNER